MTEAFNRGMFLYRGNAVGTGSSSFRTKADSSLPTIGGVAKNVAEGYFHRPLRLTFERVATGANGLVNFKDQSFETRVEAHAEFFTIGNTFHLDEASIALTSHHSGKLDDAMHIRMDVPKELHFTFAGYPATAHFNSDLLELDTFPDFVRALNQKGFAEELGESFYQSESFENEETNCGIPVSVATVVSGYLIYSPVSHIEWEGANEPGNRVDGHVLSSRKHGRCYVAETYREQNSLRSNLFRFDLGKVEVETRPKSLFTASFMSASSLKDDNIPKGKRAEGDGTVIISGVETNGVYVPP